VVLLVAFLCGVFVVGYFWEVLGFEMVGLSPYLSPFKPPTSPFLPLLLPVANDYKTLPFLIHYLKIVEVNRMTVTKINLMIEGTPMKEN
jgi:hypothetical protein